MTTPPETRYARSGELRIAYQVVGDGPLDLVYVPGFVSNIELMWEIPEWANWFSRLAAFSRLILFDKRGTGLSDRVAGIANLEDRMDDVRAVMDAAGCERAALFGISEGGPMSLLFAATYPERAQALVLCGTYARYPNMDDDTLSQHIEEIDRAWGTGQYTLRRFLPSGMADERMREVIARFERQSASPGAVIAIRKMNRKIDVRHILPAIRVPTLVMHRSGEIVAPIDGARYLADNIPGAKFVELPGANHYFLFEPEIVDRIIGETEEFLTGSRSSDIETDRVLATVMFTDIIDSTRRAVELGDRRWRALLDRHDEAVQQQLARFRGREAKNLGDGFMATFDGPARGVRCAAAISDAVQPLGIAVRSGLHIGEIELTRDDIAGIAVHIAARVAAEAEAGETIVSSTVRDLVAGSGLRFQDRGMRALKGLPEAMHLYRVLDAR
jgi:pimeloyl-ACP methyl ester carboxylesterase/class 3 adenylate cyclase